jgi:hypothetical protein
MPDNPLTVTTSEDGSEVVLTAAHSTISIPTQKLSEVITLLIRTLGHPLVSPHGAPSTPLTVGTTAEVRPLPLVGMNVTKVFLVNAVGLFLDLAGGLRLYFQFSQDDATRLSQLLQKAVEQAKQSDPTGKH